MKPQQPRHTQQVITRWRPGTWTGDSQTGPGYLADVRGCRSPNTPGKADHDIFIVCQLLSTSAALVCVVVWGTSHVLSKRLTA